MMPQKGDRVRITLYNDEANHPLCGPATVMYCSGNGTGFRFRSDVATFEGGEGYCDCSDEWEPLTDDTQVTTLQTVSVAPNAAEIAAECDALKQLLLAKNEAYGDSALNPVQIFCKADPVTQIQARIDDKLSRLVRGSDAGEDTVQDLIGYLIMLRIAQRKAKT